jgi:hypothetical protein
VNDLGNVGVEPQPETTPDTLRPFICVLEIELRRRTYEYPWHSATPRLKVCPNLRPTPSDAGVALDVVETSIKLATLGVGELDGLRFTAKAFPQLLEELKALGRWQLKRFSKERGVHRQILRHRERGQCCDCLTQPPHYLLDDRRGGGEVGDDAVGVGALEHLAAVARRDEDRERADGAAGVDVRYVVAYDERAR